MSYACKVLQDSMAPCGARLTSFEVTFPRIVLAEFNTHRLFARSSASSRAVPVEKRIAAVESDPFVPEQFGKNQRGMQASETLDGAVSRLAEDEWRLACAAAVRHARALAQLGVHKQLANRLLEPFLWHTVVVSATEWENFFAQRCHPAAQPEIRRPAEMMRDAYEASEPARLRAGEWHLPYVTLEGHDGLPLQAERWVIDWRKVSVARCARVSYLTQDGRHDPEEDLRLFDRLVSAQPMHASPLEHIAQARATPEPSGPFVGWRQYRKLFRAEYAGAPRHDLAPDAR